MEKPDQLIQYALNEGADGAVVVGVGDIVIDPGLADMCREPRCPEYGRSVNCPPHVAGPSAMKRRLESFHKAVVFRISVPAKDLFSDKRSRVFRQLHQIAAGIEQAAVEMGFSQAQGYAGGSCRELFCSEHPDCPPLSGKGACRYSRLARPSMSGFGIDVAALFTTAGWTLRLADPQPGAAVNKSADADLCGLVLID